MVTDSLTYYSTAQRQLETHMWSAGSAPKGDISTTHYRHAGARKDFSCVNQSLPVRSADVFKIPTHATYAYTIKHATHEWIETRSQYLC